MPVRRDALWFLATKRPDLASQPLRSALLDNHTSMRETARQFLAVAEINDVSAFYANAVEGGEDKQRFAAICGLGEVGTASDVRLVVPFLTSTLTKLRRAAVYAIGKLDVEGQLERLAVTLSDEKPSVSREAMKALTPKAQRIPLPDLERLLATGANLHVRGNALTLIVNAGKWKKLPAVLTACTDAEARIAEQADRALRDWSLNYNRSFAEPTREDFERIQAVLGKVESRLPHGFAAELRACLQIYFK